MSKLDLVNIKQGSDSTTEFSNGNTLPYTMLPFGMNAFCPMTDENSCYFQPRSRRLFGIRLTHQPSPWIGDYGQMLIMPETGGFNTGMLPRASSYTPKKSTLRPDYIDITFNRYGVRTELSPTERGAAMKFTFDGREGPNRICFFSMGFYAQFHLAIEKKELTGFTRALRHGGDPKKFAEYFVIRFEGEIDAENTQRHWFEETERVNDRGEKEKRNEDRFDTGRDVSGFGCDYSVAFSSDTVTVRMATSYISAEQARVNLDREIGTRSFEEVRDAAAAVWEERLGSVEIEHRDPEQVKTFYTCLYRAHTFPHRFYEISEDGRILHYNTVTHETVPGVSYVDNGFWDTGRTCYSFYSLMCPDDLKEMIQGYLNIYKDSGWLPKWLGPGEIGAMPGTFIDCVLADAAVKGILTREQTELALEAMIHHAEVKPSIPINGRWGINEFKELGYVPYEGFGESVNHTLDYAFGDFCIGQIASLLGKKDVAEKYYARSLNYRNLYNKEKGWMIGRDRNGEWRKDFDEFAWGRDYCEAGTWQGTWAVFHDFMGLADLMGGRDVMVERLDKVHTTPPYFKTGGYWFEIHEMSEMACEDFGQCAICNQPSFHIPYASAAAGKRSTTQQVVRRMTSKLFSYKDDGFPGDEDNGSMSCWYLMSAMGIYPFCVGTGEFVVGAPRFDKMTVTLGNGNKLTIIAENNEEEFLYCSSIKWNGNELDKAYIDYSELMKGGELRFVMSPVPDDSLLPPDKLPMSISRKMDGAL